MASRSKLSDYDKPIGGRGFALPQSAQAAEVTQRIAQLDAQRRRFLICLWASCAVLLLAAVVAAVVVDAGLIGVAAVITFGVIAVGAAGYTAARNHDRTDTAIDAANGKYLAARRRLDPLNPAAWSSPRGGEVTQEARLIVVALEIIESIKEHPVWASDWLATQRLQLNLGEELDQIRGRAAELHDLRHRIGDAPDKTVNNGRAYTLWADYIATLDSVLDGLVQRVAALEQYRQHLDYLAAIQAAADQASTISTLQDRIDTLVGDAGTDAAAAHRVSGLSDELGDVREGLTSIVQFLSAYPARLPGAVGPATGDQP